MFRATRGTLHTIHGTYHAAAGAFYQEREPARKRCQITRHQATKLNPSWLGACVASVPLAARDSDRRGARDTLGRLLGVVALGFGIDLGGAGGGLVRRSLHAVHKGSG